jgi:hypothetical protein
MLAISTMRVVKNNNNLDAGKKILLATLLGILTACSDNSPLVEAPLVDTLAADSPSAMVDTGIHDGQNPKVTCEPLVGMTPYCGFKNPEDLIPVPGGEKLLVSEMGEFMLDTPGALSLFDIETGGREALMINWQNSGDTWGEKTCMAPDQALFSPHGIDFMTRTDGRHELLVVNHGGREAVEFFELIDSNGIWQLDWKGCALPPEDPFINDVAALNDGGFFVTHMWNKSPSFEDTVAKLMAGENTGWVWEWQAETGFTKVPGSQQMMPNGITVSRDPNNTKLFVNIYMASKTIKIDRATGEVEAEFKVQQPDNITIDDDGNLWVASHKHDPIAQTCNEVKSGPCLLPFEIVKANAETMVAEVVLSHDGEPMGYSTVALNFGGKIYMGSAHGDRIVSVELE